MGKQTYHRNIHKSIPYLVIPYVNLYELYCDNLIIVVVDGE